MPPVRLQKILAAAGLASRRTAETLIAQGRVTVNGAVVRELGTKADPDRDEIRVDGRRVKHAERMRYILLNKPRRVVTTRRDPEGRPTVMDLLRGVHESLYPVGRLDYDSEGLLLLTNDGALAERVTHPRHGVLKRYRAQLAAVPSPDALATLARGVVIDGERTGPAEVRVLKTFASSGGRDRSVIEIGIHEGRNRQVRRMCEAVGCPVSRLERVAIGPIADRMLKPGRWRELTTRELDALKAAVDLD
jgi:pseudouridine synthase